LVSAFPRKLVPQSGAKFPANSLLCSRSQGKERLLGFEVQEFRYEIPQNPCSIPWSTGQMRGFWAEFAEIVLENGKFPAKFPAPGNFHF
jgi:hypothetical protein